MIRIVSNNTYNNIVTSNFKLNVHNQTHIIATFRLNFYNTLIICISRLMTLYV